MVKKIGSSFGDFQKTKTLAPNKIKPITTEFSKGSVPDSIYSANRESAWTRWRKGFELATALTYNSEYVFPFSYSVPDTTTSGNPSVTISGAFVGFPTTNKEFGMHWTLWRYAGSFRTDSLQDPISTQKLYVESVTEDSNYWYVKLAGSWSPSNPLPPPFYISVPGQSNGLKPANTEIFEDRIITANGPIIDKETIDPTTQKRYGYVQAVVVNVNQNTGVLTFKKSGSVYVTPDAVFTTPAPKPFEVGRYLITGARYACTCQDFTHRDYSFISTGGGNTKKQFPKSSKTSIKPGRFEEVRIDGKIDSRAMTRADVNRTLETYAPQGFELDYTVSESTTDRKAVRDNPGVYRDFGAVYTRSTGNIATIGSQAEGMPSYDDYSSFIFNPDSSSISQDVILSITDNWTPLLDELRYCKHIYALRFKDRVFPPEPSDFPVGPDSMANWEQRLVKQTEEEIKKAKTLQKTKRALALMDVPPYNCQSPMIYPMLQKLFNIATDKITIDNFTML